MELGRAMMHYLPTACGRVNGGRRGKMITPPLTRQEIIMAWTTPAATDLRFGFEITMYIANR
jgi:coenzyme PQQ precursor peptide PqqA